MNCVNNSLIFSYKTEEIAMKSRRGTNLWSGMLGEMIRQFEAGDIVLSTQINHDVLYGVVQSVHPRINKVMVAWNGGSLVQHDPDEIALHPHGDGLKAKMNKVASFRRVRAASDVKRILG